MIKAQEVVQSGAYGVAPVTMQKDTTLLAPHIKDAMIEYVLPIVGPGLYDFCVANMHDGNCNYNPLQGTLINKFPNNANLEALWTTGGLYELAAWAVYLMALPYSSIQDTNFGLQTISGQHSQSGEKYLKFLQDDAGKRILTKQRGVFDYLCKNKATITQFDGARCDDGCNSDGEKEQYGGENFGIVFY